jgi:hypothetical protein
MAMLNNQRVDHVESCGPCGSFRTSDPLGRLAAEFGLAQHAAEPDEGVLAELGFRVPVMPPSPTAKPRGGLNMFEVGKSS